MESEKHIPPHSSRALGIWTRPSTPENLLCITRCLRVITTHSVTKVRYNTSLDNSDTRSDRLQSVVVHTKGQKKNQNPRTETFSSIYRRLLQVHDFELGPPEEPCGINHSHHQHKSSLEEAETSGTPSTTMQGIPFSIPLPACCSHPLGILQSPSRSSS